MRSLFETAAVFVCAFAYFACFRDYGFQLEDEGTLLFHLDRASRGMQPYTDFHTGYTPGFFAVGAWLLEALEYRLESIRAALSVLNALCVAGVFALARGLAGPLVAIVPALVWLLLLPVFAGGFAAFNVPYPAWPATAAWIAAALLLRGWIARPSLLTMAGLGVVVAAAFAVKPNAGAFMAAGVVWAVSPFLDLRSGFDRSLQRFASIFLALGVWAAFGFAWFGWDVVLFLAPAICAASLVGVAGAGRLAAETAPRPFPTLLCLGVGFVLPTLVWLLPTLARLGLEGFGREVLLLGSGAAALYHTDHPLPEFFAMILALAVLGAVVVARLLSLGRITLRTVALLALLPIGPVLYRLFSSSLAVEGVLQALLRQFENAGMLVAPLVHLGALLFAVRYLSNQRESDAPRVGDKPGIGRVPLEHQLVGMVPMATAMYLMVWPRVDFTHFVWAVPVSLGLAAGLALRVGGWLDRTPGFEGGSLSRVAAVAIGLGFSVFAVAKAGLVLPAAIAADRDNPVVATARVFYSIDEQASDEHRSFGKTLAWLGARTEPGEMVLGFPGMSGALFALGLRNPVPHDYWYAGRPNHADEAQMLQTLKADPPRYIATLNRRWVFFQESPRYFAATRKFVQAHYRLAARFGRYDLLSRNDLAPEGFTSWQPTGPLAALIEPSPLARQQAGERWLAGMQAAEAKAAALPASRHDALLLLRAIRETSDLRAAAWLVEGWNSADGPLQREALHAMRMVADSFDAARFRWAGDFEPSDLKPWVEHLVPWAKSVMNDSSDVLRWFASTILFVVGERSDEPLRPSDYAPRAPDA